MQEKFVYRIWKKSQRDYFLSFIVYEKRCIPATHSLCMFDKTCNIKMPAATSPLIWASLQHGVVLVLWPLPLLVAWVWDLQQYIQTNQRSSNNDLLQIILRNVKNIDDATVKMKTNLNISEIIESFEIVSFTAPKSIDSLIQSIKEPPNTLTESAAEVRAWLRLTYATTLTLISVYSWCLETKKNSKLVTSVANLIRDHVAIRLSHYICDNDKTQNSQPVDVVESISSYLNNWHHKE